MTTHLMDEKGNPCCGGSNVWPNSATERRPEVDCTSCLDPLRRKTAPSRPTSMDKLKDEVAVLRSERDRLQLLMGRIVWNTVGKKPEEQDPPGNRLQIVYCLAVEAIGPDAARAAAKEEPR